MDAFTAKQKAMDWLRTNSGIDQHRPYLGMSAIGRCPRLLYDQFLNGRGAPTDRAHINCYSGYQFEGMVKRILGGAGILVARERTEIVAPFDERFRGHVDGETVDGQLLEIKSMSIERFADLKASRRVSDDYFDQVQACMRYGGWRTTLFVAVCRDSFELYFLEIGRNERAGERIERKAKEILAAIDRCQAPRCECGHCKTAVAREA